MRSNMDFLAALKQLRDEKRLLDVAIATLEQLGGHDAATPHKRGRKGMPDAERAAVSKRMAKYWEKRRLQKNSKKSTS